MSTKSNCLPETVQSEKSKHFTVSKGGDKYKKKTIII